MPKKRTFNHLKQHQGQSSSLSRPPASRNDALASSVNEKLSELRRIEGPDAASKKRDIAELVSQRSIPPELRGILGVPESAPPRSRPGVRMRDRLRTPGPAPPRSWTSQGAGRWVSTFVLRGRRKVRNGNSITEERFKPREVERFVRAAGLSSRSENFDRGAHTLMHYTLKTLATQWDLLDEEDYPALADLPLLMRLQLLSYLCVYGPGVDQEAFDGLTQGSDKVTYLDLSGLAGHSTLTLPRLIKRFRAETPQMDQTATVDVADSWEEEESSESSLSNGLSPSRFSNLTHLSLSHPPSTILWRDLLSFTKHTPQITHLSLAYWPRPTLTPNLSTTMVSSQYGPDVTAGGSHIYSTLDQDLNEPASILRQLSLHLLRLQWLDIEGCTSWAPALALLAAFPKIPGHATNGDDWSSAGTATSSVLVDTWKNLNYINVAQGWLPTHAGLKALPTQQGLSSDRPMVREILTILPVKEAETHDQLSIEKQKAMLWLEAESKVLGTMRRINFLRRNSALPLIVLDFGWARKTR